MAIHTAILNDCIEKILLYKSKIEIFTVVKTICTRQEATTRHCPSNVLEWPTCAAQLAVAAGGKHLRLRSRQSPSKRPS